MTTLEHAIQRFETLRRRVRSGSMVETVAMLLLALAGYAVVTFALDRQLRLEWPFRLALLAGLVYGAARIVRRRWLQPMAVALDDDEMAFAVERQSPGLRQSLISSLQFERVIQGGRIADSRELMTAVIEDVQGRLHGIAFDAAIDAARLRRFTALAAGMLALFLGWGVVHGQSLRIWALRNLLLSSTEWPRYTQLSFVGAEKGTVRLPQGDPFTVRVAVQGPVPDQVFLDYEFRGGEHGTEPMSRTGDGEFTLLLESLLDDATLIAEGGDGITAPLRVEIVERPRLEDVALSVEFPDYMHKEPEPVPATEGELRMPRGSALRLAAKSRKTAQEAFALFEDEKLPLQLAADRRSFSGRFQPKASGMLKLDVIDDDRLGAASPPRLQVRLIDDKAPTVDFKLRGISTLVTPQARIPGELKVKDDFGLTRLQAVYRVVIDASAPAPADAKPQPKPEDVPFAPIQPNLADALTPGATKYETTASFDLRMLNKTPDTDAADNTVRPGMLLSLRFAASDNFGPGDPHTANGELLSFRVVTREKMLEELRRRQVEQRQELERIRDEERTAQMELRDTLNPNSADERAKLARTRFKTLARQQQALSRRVAFVGEAYQRILWEFENNRLLEPSRVREIEAVTSVPLAELAREPFPATARQVDEFAGGGDEQVRSAALTGYDQILTRLEAIIQVMTQAETLAALLEQLRGVIKTQDQSVQEVEKRIKDAAKSTFGKDRK